MNTVFEFAFISLYLSISSPQKTLGQFENFGFVIMSTGENIRLIARAPLDLIGISLRLIKMSINRTGYGLI